MSKVVVDVRRQKSISAKTVAANKDRLKALASAIESEMEGELLGLNATNSGPLSSNASNSSIYSGAPLRKPLKDVNWRHCLIGCGSNAFSQLNLDNEVMATSFMHCPLHAHASNIGDSNIGLNAQVNKTHSLSKKASSNNVSADSENGGVMSMHITDISTGANGSAAIMNGTVYLWGELLGGSHLRVPTPLANFNQVTQVSCGDKHIGMITSTGECYTWGSNEHGMLGHGLRVATANGSGLPANTGPGATSMSVSHFRAPKLVEAFTGMVVTSISCGG